jgi:glycerol-3-phosphate acyltransferase PlsY
MTIALLVLTAYLLGSVPTSYLVVQFFHGLDIRRVGTTNPGMMNVWDNLGFASALLVAIGDIGKGSLAVGLAYWLGADGIVVGVVALTVVLGHDFSVFLKFHGGNGMAPAVGAVIALLPISTIYILITVIALYLVTRRKRLSGIVGILMIPSLSYLLGYEESKILIAVLVLTLAVLKVIRFEGFSADRKRQPEDLVRQREDE